MLHWNCCVVLFFQWMVFIKGREKSQQYSLLAMVILSIEIINDNSGRQLKDP
jgi:hypothetical protein